MKRWPIALLILALFAGVLYWKREPAVMAFAGAIIEKSSDAERVALLSTHTEIRLPEGETPFPVVIQFHGCAGVRAPFQRDWADIANKAGYAAMIVDSNGARGFDRAASVEKVCGGKALLGQERAGDVLAAIEIADADPRLDASRMVLAGWSHGAWSVMDYFTMDPEKTTPPGLVRERRKLPEAKGAILFYPYCGFGARIHFQPYVQSPPTLALIAGADEIVDAQRCIEHFGKRKAEGGTVDMVVYDGANHVFDDRYLEPELQSWFNEDYYQDAAGRYEGFLTALGAPENTAN